MRTTGRKLQVTSPLVCAVVGVRAGQSQGGGAETLDAVGVGLGRQPARAGWAGLAGAVGVVYRGSCGVPTASLCAPPLPSGAGLPGGTLCLNMQVC